ncbi:MAG: hypothetical protein GXY87_03055 [Tissierellia bacterium]|nr:hypothetical protein [Tissierellia bacterium]
MNIPKTEHERMKFIHNMLKKIDKPKVEGCLIIYYRKKYPEYYHSFWDKEKKKETRIYLKKDMISLIKQLAMKEYYESLERVLNQIQGMMRRYRQTDALKSIDDIYESYQPIKKALIKPIIPTYRMMVEQWKASCIKSDYPFGTNEIYTKKGERVRSKSEKILADTFFDKGIDYVYEARLDLKDGSAIYPDFTFLHPRTREFIYWEHNGKMNDLTYVHKAIRRIIRYERAGIYQNDRLVVTYESVDLSLSPALVESLIERYLL